MISVNNSNTYEQICSGILCFGDSDWWYHNRGHMDMQLMKRYAGFTRVLYVNSVMVRKFNIGEGGMFVRRVRRKLRSIMRGIKPSGIGNMAIYSPFSMPVHHIHLAKQLNALVLRMQIRRCLNKLNMEKPLIWVTCPGAAKTAVRLPRTKLVYQRSDVYERLAGVDGDQIKRYDRLLKENADLVIYVSRELMACEKGQCRRALFLDHGVDYELFAGAERSRYVPDEMKQIHHPIAGFYGNIDEHTFDISLVEKLCDLLSDFSIVLIGNSSIDLSALARRKNVCLIGQRPYEQIPYYARCFDVCLMPWRQNEWISACNPIKLKEYLALGKPVVSTPFAELENYKDVVSIASDAESFAEAVDGACDENGPEKVRFRRRRVCNSTWDAKAQEVLRALQEIN